MKSFDFDLLVARRRNYVENMDNVVGGLLLLLDDRSAGKRRALHSSCRHGGAPRDGSRAHRHPPRLHKRPRETPGYPQKVSSTVE